MTKCDKDKKRLKHIIEQRKWREKVLKERPWMLYLISAKNRCRDKRNKKYHKKGIKCFITESELRVLWFRNKAYLLKEPSLDRINSLDNYTFRNCRFIEKSLNSSMKITNKINYLIAQKIRKEFSSGETTKILSERYGVTRRFITDICCSKWYKPETYGEAPDLLTGGSTRK